MNKIKDKFILLFAPHPQPQGRRMIPLGLLAISAFLDQEGYDIRIYHAYDKNEYLEAIEKLDKAIAVGITAMTGYQIYDGLQFAQLVRKKNQKVPIIWGGIHSTIMPRQTAEHQLVDIVVKGQGEETFTELIHCLAQGKSFDNVLGITFKKDGKIIDNPPRLWKSINDFPPLPYHLLNKTMDRYLKKSAFAEKNLSYITSSGCPFCCSFCFLAANAETSRWDAYPPERVVKEIENLVQTYNIDGIEIRDSNFFVNPKRVKDICLGLINNKIKINLSCVNGRAEQLIKYDDQMWRLLKEAGIKEILIGAESGDQAMLDLINKKSTVEAILACEEKAKRFKINTVNSFMTSFPPPTANSQEIKRFLKDELNKTVGLISEIFQINPLANILLFFYTPYPGTPMYRLSVEKGFKEPANLEGWGQIDLDKKVTPWTSPQHYKKVLLLEKLFRLKKITTGDYLKTKSSWHYRILKKLKITNLLNWWVTQRLKYKFYILPFERLILKK